MKHIVQNIWALLILLSLAGCATNSEMPEQISEQGRTLHVTALVARKPAMNAVEKDLNSDNVILTWEKGSFTIQVIVKQGVHMVQVNNVIVKDVYNDGHTADFDVTLPPEIDSEKPFELIGAVGNRLMLKDGKILLGVEAHAMYDLFGVSSNKDADVPVWFHAKNVEVGKASLQVQFEHLGAMAVIGIHNAADKPLRTAGFALVPHGSAPAFYHKAALPFEGNTELPYIDLLNPTAAPQMVMSRVLYPEVVIPARTLRYVGFWFMPNGTVTPEVDLVAYDADSRKPIVSANTKPAKGKTMMAGKAYNLYAQWDGAVLKITDGLPAISYADAPYVNVHTERAAGETFRLIVDGADVEARRDIWVDLNNNGKREKGENISARSFSSDYKSKPLEFKLQAQEFKIYGRIAFLWVNDNDLTMLDISKSPTIKYISAIGNRLSGSLDFSANTELATVELGQNAITEISFGNNTQLTDIYLNENKLKIIDLSALTSLYALDLSANELESIVMKDKHPEWMYVRIQNNKLPATMIDAVYKVLPKAGEKDYNWQYTISVGANPGTNTAQHAVASDKGWQVYR